VPLIRKRGAPTSLDDGTPRVAPSRARRRGTEWRREDNHHFVRIFFVGTDRPEINAARVARRVLQAGHEVPIRKIIERWGYSIANAAAVAAGVDRFYLYDNSVDDRDAQLVLRAADGRVVKAYGDAPDPNATTDYYVSPRQRPPARTPEAKPQGPDLLRRLQKSKQKVPTFSGDSKSQNRRSRPSPRTARSHYSASGISARRRRALPRHDALAPYPARL
jgi:hypothetical protein